MGLADITRRLATVEAQAEYTRRWVNQNNSLLSSVAAFDQRISDLEGKGSSFSDILLAYAGNFRSDGDGIGFIFFTDPHDMTGYEDYQVLEHLSMVKTLYENSPARYVICGGDWLNTHHTLATAKYRGGRVPNLIKNGICEKAYTVIGNHDLNVEAPEDTSLTETQLAKMWFDSDVGYYIIDTSDTTCYMFDSGSQSKAMTTYRWTQVDWFADKLLENTKAHLFGLIHIIGNTQSDTSNDYPELGQNITKVADAFNQRTSVTLNGKTYDFTNATGTFHFILSGHYHMDFSRTINNIPIVYTKNGYAVDCCYADFTQNKLFMTRAALTSVANQDRTIGIIPAGGYQSN